MLKNQDIKSKYTFLQVFQKHLKQSIDVLKQKQLHIGVKNIIPNTCTSH